MKTKFFILGLAIIMAPAVYAFTPPVEEGKTIFMSRCASCHNINKTLTGPALAGLAERRSIDWIINFVNSSQSMVKNGDKDAVALFEKFNRIPMPDHLDLTAEHIKSIVSYIESESKPTDQEKAPFAKPSVIRPNYLPLTLQQNPWFFVVVLASVALLIAVLLVAVRVYEMKHERVGS